MSSIGTKLLNSLRSIERPGDFCVGGIREIFMPTIDVHGVGKKQHGFYLLKSSSD